MRIDLSDIKVGEEVLISSSDPSGDYDVGWFKVQEIKEKINSSTGQPYIMIRINDQWFEGKTGWADEYPLTYYISNIKKK